MSLEQWLENSWIRKVEPSKQEIANLLAVAKREIADASLDGMSPDGRFVHAYDAIRVLCETALHARGYAVKKGERQHERALESLKFTLAGDQAKEVDFYDQARRLRHKSMYERMGVVEQKLADDLLEGARKLYAGVEEWLRREHPNLV